MAIRSARSAEEWEGERRRGLRSYLVRQGVVGRGLPLGTLVAIVVQYSRSGDFPDSLASVEFAGLFALCVGVFSLSGMLSARAMWNLNEKRFPRSS